MLCKLVKDSPISDPHPDTSNAIVDYSAIIASSCSSFGVVAVNDIVLCCYVTITGQLVTSYDPKTNMIGKYVTRVKPVYMFDTLQEANLNLQTLSKTAT